MNHQPAATRSAAALALALALCPAGGHAAETAATAPAGAPAGERFAGLWQGAVVYGEARFEIEVLVELALDAEGRLAGTIDLPIYRIQYRPLEDVAVDGDRVSFLFRNYSETRGPDAPYTFEGTLSADRRTIAGDFTEFTGKKPFRLERIGEPFSERPPVVDPPLEVLSPAGDELRAAFNRDADHVRLVLLMSPT